MILPNSNIYLETSAINFLADKYSHRDGRATHAYHLMKGTKFYISNVSVWEILLTSNKVRREQLIQYIQNIGYPKLINSPSEMIINYIKAGFPVHEPHYDFHSKLPLASTWKDICEERNKTFIFEEKRIKKMSKMIRSLFKTASKEIEDTGLIIPYEKEPTEIQKILTDKVRQIKRLNYYVETPERKIIIKLSMLLILLILCNEVELDSQPIRAFWAKKGINGTFERLDYVVEEMDLLVTRGPFPVLAEMTYAQIRESGKQTRGIYWDVLHSLYLIYSDIFMTNDDHFKKLKKQNNHLVFQRVLHMKDVKWFTAKKIELME